jgi:hypothetical protein
MPAVEQNSAIGLFCGVRKVGMAGLLGCCRAAFVAAAILSSARLPASRIGDPGDGRVKDQFKGCLGPLDGLLRLL